MAAPLFKKLLEEGENVKRQYRECIEILRRRAWKKGDITKFQALGDANNYQLPIARLKGKETLQELGAASSGQDSLLARCAISDNIKTALIEMRRNDSLKQIAEGWISLLKNDPKRAYAIFCEAEPKQPARANLGKAIALLLDGNIHQALDFAQRFRPIAVHRFPVLAETLGWKEKKITELKNNGDENISNALLFGSFADIQKLTKILKKESHPLKPWLTLRLGDLHSEKKDFRSADRLWSKVERKFSTLQLDVLKRQMLISIEKENNEMVGRTVKKIYTTLGKEDPKEARKFLEMFVFDIANDSQILSFDVEDYCRAERCWKKETPAIEIVLLLFIQILQVFGLDFEELELEDLDDEHKRKKMEIPELSFWELLFPQLDEAYENNEMYLRSRLKLCKFYDSDWQMQLALFLRIKNFPLLKREFLPRFFSLARTTLKDKRTREQIEELKKVVPTELEISRLSIAITNDMKLLDEEKKKYPQSLAGILDLQAKLDQKCRKKKIVKTLPPLEWIGKDEQTDCRFAEMIMQGELEKYVDHNLRHNYFRQMCADRKRARTIYDYVLQNNSEKRNLTSISCYLEEWLELFPEEGFVFYAATCWGYIFHPYNNHTEMLDKALSLMDKQDPQYDKAKMLHRISSTFGQ